MIMALRKIKQADVIESTGRYSGKATEEVPFEHLSDKDSIQ